MTTSLQKASATTTGASISPLVKRHAEDAAFYWKQRANSTHSPLLTLPRLAHFDRLLDAHLDGLRVAGEAGWDIALANLRRWRTCGECFVASALLLEGREASRFDMLWQIVRTNPESMLSGLISALDWIAPELAQNRLEHWLNNAQFPAWQAIALRGYAIRRQLPATPILSLCTSPDAEVRAASALLVGRTRWQRHLPQVQMLLQDDTPTVRHAAALALHRLGQPELAIRPLHQGLLELNNKAQAERGLSQQKTVQRALTLARHLGHALPLNYPHIAQLTQTLPVRQTLLLLAHHGNPVYVPWLLQCMQQKEAARLAGWAFMMITGLELDAPGLTQAPPEEAEQNEQYERQRLISDPDLGLPWPNVAALQGWWQSKQSSLPQAKLLWGGAATDATHCLRLLADAPQAARYAAAQALAQQDLQRPLFETRAASIKQKSELAELMQEVAT